jgi:ribosomal protein S19E (S16A)
MIPRYTFTQPITKNRFADYVIYLQKVNLEPHSIKYNSHIVSLYNMTFQELREAGLITYNKGFAITEKGKRYLEYVTSFERPKKDVLKSILKGNL